jgi:hypothetical protein
MPAAERQITARDVILEVVHNMREGIEPMLYSSIAPAVYQVFLHADDFERLDPIGPRLVDEARRALDEETDALNGGSRLVPAFLRKRLSPTPAIERPEGGWVIHLQADPDGDLKPGHIAVTSELSLPQRQQFEGTETKRVTTVNRGTGTETSRQVVAVATPGTARTPVATLTYTDDTGPHCFAIDKDRVVIGRGGIGYWVDVKLHAAPDISREHLRIRRDPQSGSFFVKDLSSFGTTLDGVAIPRRLEVVDGQKRDLEVEVPLPARARLVLADLLTIDFDRREAPR